MQSDLLRRLSKSCKQTARLHRLGMAAGANQEMLQLIDDLIQLTADPVSEARIGPLLIEVLNAQERGDALCVADQLEFVLLPELELKR